MSAPTLPTGTLTFLFTDVEGSTRLLNELGDAYGELLEQHRKLIREAISAHGGVEFGTGGDALFVVFESATGAVAAAADAQRRLEAHEWTDGAAPRVRMAVHTGEARLVDGDYIGLPLHVVARLCAAGHGGQVLVSGTTRAVCASASVTSLGMHRLRDVADGIDIFQLRIDGLTEEFPPLRTLSAVPNNLPIQSDRFVGRELEIVEVAEALSDRRLVTLTGPGGSGKTRLALEVSESLLPASADGVWFVALGAATTPDQIEDLTAQVLHVGGRNLEPLGVSLRTYLASREVLLVLDNCEHLVDAAAAFVAALLEQCPRVRVLATSREVLGVRGEQAIVVAPLGDPEAVQLFVDRARAAVPGFDDATEDPAAVAEICRRLDGLPLAIELAAARLRGVSLRQIAQRLDDRFRLLGSGRTRTLEAVVSWSYDLLDPTEQAVFRRLALFADSFDLDAAEAVAGTDDVLSVDVVDIVLRLVEKSLLVTIRAGDDYRYRMLETLRQYGRAQMRREGDLEAGGARLGAWARAWTERLEHNMRTPAQDATMALVARERENLRAVYQDARQRGDAELALRIVTFAPIMLMDERLVAIDELLAVLVDVPASLRGHAYTSQSQFAFSIGDQRKSIEMAQRAAELFESIGDRNHAAFARYFEVFAAWGYVADDEVADLAAAAIVEFRALDQPFGLAYMLWVTSQLEPDLDLADAQAAESEALFRDVGALFGLAHGLEGRALVCVRRNELERAAAFLAEAIPILADSGEQGCLAHGLEAAAALMSVVDERVAAAVVLGAAEELRRRSGHAHRPWEMRSRAAAEEALAGDDLETERAAGRAMELDSVLAEVDRVLDRTRIMR